MEPPVATGPELTRPTVDCSRCAGKIPMPETSGFIHCEFCGTGHYLDTRDVVLCLALKVQIQSGSLVPRLRTYLNNHGLTGNLELRNFEGVYFPVWEVRLGSRILRRTAASSPYEEIQAMRIPPGVFEPVHFEVSDTMEWWLPDVSEEVVRNEWASLYPEETGKLAIRLLYVPVYTLEYDYSGRTFRATLDAVGGKILSEEIPPAPHLAMDRSVLFLCILLGLFFAAEAVFFPGFWITLGVFFVSGLGMYPLIKRHLLHATRSRP